MKVTELKEQQQTAKSGGGKQKEHATNQAAQLGLTVRQLDAQEKEQAETQGNLVVEEVTGPAASAGVQPGRHHPGCQRQAHQNRQGAAG